MSYSKNYNDIKVIIDEIIGVETQQGKNLKKAIKKYFELEAFNVKLITDNPNVYETKYVKVSEFKYSEEMKDAMNKYTDKIKANLDKIKAKGDYCGING
tara:strand:+ start:6173 stop:6469 length:297 start_codon:yes stop_codon:yes gene_type:complete